MPSSRRRSDHIAVIDLFAGPGGLGEGFSSCKTDDSNFPFKVVLSAENDPTAQQTLELRSFYRQFRDRALPTEYSAHVKGDITREVLFALHPKEGSQAVEESQLFALGEPNRKRLERRLDALFLDRDRTVVIGGPPCQAYSIAGRSRNGAKYGWSLETDSRSHLYQEYLHVLSHVEPAAFVMENVRGMISARMAGKSVFDRVYTDLARPSTALGRRKFGRRYRLVPVTAVLGNDSDSFEQQPDYHPTDFLVRMEDYGVPQARHRIIIVGIAEDIPRRTSLGPLVQSRRTATVSSAICNLPSVRSAISTGPDSHERWLSALRFALRRSRLVGVPAEVRSAMKYAVEKAAAHDHGRGSNWLETRRGNHVVLNHQARSHMASDLERYLFASAWASVHGSSPTLHDFPSALLPRHANIQRNGEATIFSDRFRVQVWHVPSTTVVSHISKDGHYYIHPDPSQCRSFTVREAAALQTFPSDYYFCGPRTSQFHQVGNAVPVAFARQVANALADLLS